MLSPARRARRRGWAAAILGVTLIAVSGCASAASEAVPANTSPCAVPPAAALVPQTGALLGVSIDWTAGTIAEYADRLGRSPAVAVNFSGFPQSDEDVRNLSGAAVQVRASGGILLLTLEPWGGLGSVTADAADALAGHLAEVNASGVPVLVRFAHEMNGSWYPWGQQPAEYVAAFRTVAGAVHDGAPGSSMMWAPNYGGGYPFSRGEYVSVAGDPAFVALDTVADGVLTMGDDPYAPYYPGHEAVDWVGMSLYHWGSAHPWGENELPEDGKFAAQLTGEYAGLGGDDRVVPNFYDIYSTQHAKPLAIPETAALVVPRGDPAGELAIKRAWWRQVFSADTASRFPNLHMINWFEWDKTEVEVGGEVDWTVTSDPATRDAFVADLPSWLLGAEDLPVPCLANAG
jgi:hypothetical protein